ncbi:MAG: DNA translocase FtsK 4TM domain-containing protein, partial [Nevskia sp.]|nr:DNA translocase FtsK 4TM domain-containing protein [Nevskia sp.]
MFKSKKQAATPVVRRGRAAAAGAPAAEASWIERLPREAALLGCTGLALFLLVALVSFHPDDAGWSSSGLGGSPRNLGGSAGAWLANAMLSCFGYVAFVLPWAVLWLGLRLFRGHGGPARMHPGVRATAWIVALLSLAALASMYAGTGGRWVPQGSGGIAGSLLGHGLTSVLNPVGATLVLLTLFAAALPLAMIFSWLVVLDAVGGRVLALFQSARARRAERLAAGAEAAGPVSVA